MASRNMPVSLRASDIDLLVSILADLAANAFVSPQAYLRDLVMRSDLPKRYHLQLAGGFTGDPTIDARALVNFAIARGINPEDPSYTTLGSILKAVLDDVGAENYSNIVAIIVIYKLYSADKMAALKKRYLVPELQAGETAAEVGPAFDWRGPTDELELQRYRQPLPDLLDVGFLRNALEATASVCRVENTRKEKLGTGFLVAPSLVLTNYHVLSESGNSDIAATARELVLRFGAISTKGVSEDEGQTVRLRADHPILKSSPANKLDYALLGVDAELVKSQSVKAAKLHSSIPEPGMGLHILQHPSGESMKIALSTNGVTGVYRDVGLIQYLTAAKGGSSGSPCFNDDWAVVALHHAEQAKIFGTVREGILLQAIRAEIEENLTPK